MERMSESPNPTSFGRVEADGTVYVTVGDTERMVGQVPDATPDEAMAFYVRRFEALEVEVGLLEARVRAGKLSPDESRKSIATARTAVVDANAVGDLKGLEARLDALAPLLSEQAEARKAVKAQQNEETRAAKEKMVAEAEKLAAGTDWRNGVTRFRTLLDEWKQLPRIDKSTDDALWHRFSSARTQYTRRRKAQFAEQATKREAAKTVKEKIIAEAEVLASSTEWGPTAGGFRDLMQRWKAAGPAPRDVDEKLWQRFRGIQDTFFQARTAAMAEQDSEFRGNQEAKEKLLAEAEQSILPVRDPKVGRARFRDFLAQFNELGKVPRDAMRPIDNRVRALEQAVNEAEQEQWRRTDPAARELAEGTANKFQAKIDELEAKAAKAEGRGDAKKAAELRSSAESYRALLAPAKKAAEDYRG